MGLDTTKLVFGISDKVRFKPACLATKTSKTTENELVASLAMILSDKQITKALIRLRGCAGFSAPLLFANPRRQFSRAEAHISSDFSCISPSFNIPLNLNRNTLSVTINDSLVYLFSHFQRFNET